MQRTSLLLVLALVAACSTSSGNTEEPPAPSATPTTAPTASAVPKDAGAKDSGPHAASAALQRCAESKGPVGTIADVVTRLNALTAKGGDTACFIATLPRPLAVVATLNTASAQPAGGRGAPRLLLMLPKIVISAVPEGEGSKAIELGEWMGTRATIKAEIPMPVTSPIAADAPFKRILQGSDKTVCATCHGQEERHPSIPSAFVSNAIKPPAATELTIDELQELHTLCTTSGLESPRCNVIHALFDFGEVTQGAFSAVVGG
ncbi:MAG: hypothetical protein JST00_16770 [Deltaproteobacteria bacterium]|nr:hypothetical protein [Deltaproteobacteria bacterium]